MEPNQLKVKPRWDSSEFPKTPVKDALTLLVSGDGNAPLSIHQDALIYAGHLVQGAQLTHPVKHQAYLIVSQGSLDVEGHLLGKGDGLEVRDLSSISIKALTDSAVLVIDVPNNI
ncbi:MAG: redox-sensitive bicupin YhaK (pirin superfamily) [Arenicella sp.]